MATDSSVAGVLSPSAAADYDDALEDTIQGVIAALTGISGTLVRPRWTVEPTNRPDFNVNWVAFGINKVSADVFAYDVHDPAGLGSSVVERDALLSVFMSFYGPNAHGYCERMRDGLEVGQNRDVLAAAGIGIVDVGDASILPSLLKEKWVRRVDVTVQLRRRTSRTYAVLTIASGQVDLVTEERGTIPVRVNP